MSNEKLYAAAVEAINRLSSDQSVSRAETCRSLKALQEEIDISIDALRETSPGTEES